MLCIPVLLLTALSCLSLADSVCNQGLYLLASPLANYPPAQSFCTAHFPPSTVTITVGAKLAIKRAVYTTTTTTKTSTTVKSVATTTTPSARISPKTSSTTTTKVTTTTTKATTTTTKSSTTLTTTTKSSATTTTTSSQDKYASIWSSLSLILKADLSTLCSCIESHPTKTITPSTTSTTTSTTKSTTTTSLSSTTTPSSTTSSSTTTSSTTTSATTTSSTTTSSSTTDSSTTTSSTTVDPNLCPTSIPNVCADGNFGRYYKPTGDYNVYQLTCGRKYTADAANGVTVPATSFNQCFQLCTVTNCYYDGSANCLMLTGDDYNLDFDDNGGGVLDAVRNTCSN